jgi:hypothetical protein
MKKMLITLEITDLEVVEQYFDVSTELIREDLQYGDLIDFCEIVEVEVIDG